MLRVGRVIVVALVLGGMVLAVAACSGSAPAGPASGAGSPLPSGTLTIHEGSGTEIALRVEIAETQAARQRGLMDRTSLGTDSGMAFLLDEPHEVGFWMKNTLIPLSIAFWGEDGRIVDMLEMKPCEADPCPLYTPGARYVGAVEANTGWFSAHGVRVGDTTSLQR